MDHHHLLYVLEKVKAASAHGCGHFCTQEDDEDHEACVCLCNDGLIRLANKEENDEGAPAHFMWRYG